MVGGLAAITYASVPLAISALSGKRTIALGVWAAYYVIVTTIMVGIAQVSWKPLAAVDLGVSVMSLAFGLWDIGFLRGGDPTVSMPAAALSLGVQTAIAVFLFHRQIARTAAGAVGGGS
jgi:hypothetical protein